ncbi:MAG TPA: pseudouridine synthase [Polyangiaceae bacterium]|nr:pseudouridine synthase [Polyangiaceae bacterium]
MTFSPTLLYRDEDYVVADKPPGIIVHRGWANDDDDLMRAVRNVVGRHVHPLHRLDRGASGPVAFALHADAARAVGAAFAEGRVEKRYLALVRGNPPERGVIDHPIPNEEDGPRVPAVTEFTRLAVAGRYALVSAVPRTGRLHQIRRHLKHIACPLIGDVRYGKGEHNRKFRDEYDLHRLALHSTLLAFDHPATPERVVVHAKVSGALRDCLDRLGLLEAADAGHS